MVGRASRVVDHPGRRAVGSRKGSRREAGRRIAVGSSLEDRRVGGLASRRVTAAVRNGTAAADAAAAEPRTQATDQRVRSTPVLDEHGHDQIQRVLVACGAWQVRRTQHRNRRLHPENRVTRSHGGTERRFEDAGHPRVMPGF